MTCYEYGFALLCKAQEQTVLNIPKSAQNEESVGSGVDQDDTGNSKASVSNITDAPFSEEGQNSNGKYQEDGNHDSDKDDGMAGDEDYSDLDLAWKMLENARAIVEKSPNHTMQKVKIFSALAAVFMEREDIDNSLTR